MTDPAKPIRCAIYTRKSSDEGLEQAFNSLEAQREACEAYVRSQAGEGWVLMPERYDDGGYSGATMDRPALRRLLDEVRVGRVDAVIVYKVDRLTRFLPDFGRIVEVLEKHGASFVSITQAFNTTTSMGRLTLNVLLSFAQFEREVTGERIRDKIAASKAKGMWMGGNPPLGYDPPAPNGPRALVVNPAEAETVRHIFARYLELGSVHALRDELNAEGVRSKAWTTKTGRTMGGKVFARGALFHLLRNPIYIGLIQHKDRTQPGLHAGIVDPDVFQAVQDRLTANAAERSGSSPTTGSASLKGRLFDAKGAPMSPTIAYGKSKKPYRYYVSAPLLQGKRREDDGVVRRVAAAPLEALVADRLGSLGALADSALLGRVELKPGGVDLVLDLATLSGGRTEFDRLCARLGPGDLVDLEDDGAVARLHVAMRPVFRGGRTWIVGPSGAGVVRTKVSDKMLIKALRTAHAQQLELHASPMTPIEDLVKGKAPADTFRRRRAALAFLAPDIQRAILEGEAAGRLDLQRLTAGSIPLAWADQRALLGG